MVDRLGVRVYGVAVTPVSGKAKQSVLGKLDLMNREMEHLNLAIRHVRNAVNNPSTQSHAQLADAVMDLRNWMLSVVMDAAYIQYIFSADYTNGNQTPHFLGMLAGRAVNAGAEDAERDRTA